jgi:hypothetical protein
MIQGIPFMKILLSETKNHYLNFNGCNQIFQSMAITPHEKLASCCGLTMEHIPEMKLGNLLDSDMLELFGYQFEDFMKIWIYTDGPVQILRRIMQFKSRIAPNYIIHPCQACVQIYQNAEIRDFIKANYLQFLPKVLCRFNVRVQMIKGVLSGRVKSTLPCF